MKFFFSGVLSKFAVAQFATLLFFLPDFAQPPKNQLHVFVGEKIDVIPFEEGTVSGNLIMDYAFKARYRVLENVYGEYRSDTIEFLAYDHYGLPPFASFDHALLFVSEVDGKYQHEKYQYFDVYRTIDHRWAGDGDAYKFDEQVPKSRRIVKPVAITFDKVVSFDLKGLDPRLIEKFYPVPYYKIENQRAYALMGNYVEDLFLVKKEGVLKARGLF
jgi:hypothetical protein